jgi:hypothetical protein
LTIKQKRDSICSVVNLQTKISLKNKGAIMPLSQKQDKSATKAVATKTSTSDADEAKAVLAQMQAKEDNGDCAFC